MEAVSSSTNIQSNTNTSSAGGQHFTNGKDPAVQQHQHQQQHAHEPVPPPADAASVSSSTSSVNGSNNNNKRTIITHDKNGQPLSEKKLRRLEKNRLSARECRRRKREATEDMQRQINILEGENLRLRLQLQIGEEAEETSLKEQERVTQSLDELLKSGASESEVYAKIEEYKEKFADYGRDRRSAIEFHLRNIERLLMPTQTTSVIMATLNAGSAGVPPVPSHQQPQQPQQPQPTPPAPNDGNLKPAATNAPMAAGAATHSTSDGGIGSKPQTMPQSFPQTAPATGMPPPHTTEARTNAASATPIAPATPTAAVASVQPIATAAINIPSENLDSKSLFRYLVKALEVTPEQAAALKDSRFVAQEMDECLKASLSVLAELRTRLTQCGQDLETEFNIVRSILTPSQAAKFLVWVANNSACMHMLNELWSKVYPEELEPTNTDGGGSDSG